MNNQYHFLTRWRVQATPDEVYPILGKPLEYPRWWPSVYLSVTSIGPNRVHLITRGWLPYTLNWEALTTEEQPPHRISIRAFGDFNGRGIWSIVRDGAYSDIAFDWQLTADKPLLQRLSFALKPVFEANHRWAMAQGLKSLELEIERSRAATAAQMNSVASPPGPNDPDLRKLAAGAALSAGVLAGLWKARRT